LRAFRVGEPTPTARIKRGVINSQWADLIAQVKALDAGLALPLEFDDRKTCAAFNNGRASWFRRHGIRMQRRGTIIYLSKLE